MAFGWSAGCQRRPLVSLCLSLFAFFNIKANNTPNSADVRLQTTNMHLTSWARAKPVMNHLNP
jgi:hypothetical protein